MTRLPAARALEPGHARKPPSAVIAAIIPRDARGLQCQAGRRCRADRSAKARPGKPSSAPLVVSSCTVPGPRSLVRLSRLGPCCTSACIALEWHLGSLPVLLLPAVHTLLLRHRSCSKGDTCRTSGASHLRTRASFICLPCYTRPHAAAPRTPQSVPLTSISPLSHLYLTS